MRLPIWLTLGVALLVCAFGAYRIRIAFRSDEEDQRARERKGLYAMGRRTHFLIGIVYLLLGAGLIATTFGWNPLGPLFGPRTEREVDLWATSNVFRAGHRIRLQVTSSCFPRWDRNLNTAEPVGEGTRTEVAQQTVFHDATRTSRVLLPVVG